MVLMNVLLRDLFLVDWLPPRTRILPAGAAKNTRLRGRLKGPQGRLGMRNPGAPGGL